MKAGKNVVYYSLELDDKTISLRFDSCLTGIPLDNLFSRKNLVLEHIEGVSGKLLVKEYPTKTANTNVIRSHLDKLKQNNFKVDLIIVDYGDLLKPMTTRKEKREELETIYEDLRAIAKETNCPVFTASQTNRCFSVDTTTYVVEEGSKLIEKRLDQLKLEDRVHTPEGPKKIVDINKGNLKTYTLLLKSGKTIRITKNHRFPLKDGSLRSIETGLSIGDKLLVKKK